jgi:hypothetical protein
VDVTASRPSQVHPRSRLVGVGDPRGVIALHTITFTPVNDGATFNPALKLAGVRQRVTPELRLLRSFQENNN